MALAVDHRAQLEDMTARAKADPARIGAFKVLAVEAAAHVAAGRPGFGMLIDEKHGRAAMEAFARTPLSWLGRPVEQPGSRPLRFEFSQDIGSQLIEWPVGHCIKCLCYYRPDDPPELKAEQQRTLRALFDAARRVGRELLVEIIAGRTGPVGEDTVASILDELYQTGIRPDWWKLEPRASPAAWAKIAATIERNDPWCRGVVLLGLDAPFEQLEAAFRATANVPVVKGFAVGRTIFGHAAEAWLSGRMGDEEAIADMASRFEALASAWALTHGRDSR
jgi:5-dehydro-2-deoxygluconokinase